MVTSEDPLNKEAYANSEDGPVSLFCHSPVFGVSFSLRIHDEMVHDDDKMRFRGFNWNEPTSRIEQRKRSAAFSFRPDLFVHQSHKSHLKSGSIAHHKVLMSLFSLGDNNSIFRSVDGHFLTIN